MSSAVKFQVSLTEMLWLVAGIAVWLGVFHNFGRSGMIFSSPLLGAWLIFIGMYFRLRSLAVLGVFLFFTGPLVFGLLTATFDTWRH